MGLPNDTCQQETGPTFSSLKNPLPVRRFLLMKISKHRIIKKTISWLRFGFLSLTIAGFTSGGMAAEEAGEDEQLTALITGANRGLGLAFAEKFMEAGYHVIGTARKPEEATELKEAGAEIMALDVTDDKQIEALAKKLAGRKIDLLINNAGIFPKSNDRETMMKTYSVNTLGPYFLSEALIENLKLSPAPKIVNVSSQLGQLTNGQGWAGGYAFSKAALNMVTRNLHSSHRNEGMMVISIHPGHNKTDMGGDGAPLDPAHTAAKLAELVENLTPDHSGKFFLYSGQELDW